MRVSTLFVASFVISLAVCEISFEMNLEGKRRGFGYVMLHCTRERERDYVKQVAYKAEWAMGTWTHTEVFT